MLLHVGTSERAKEEAQEIRFLSLLGRRGRRSSSRSDLPPGWMGKTRCLSRTLYRVVLLFLLMPGMGAAQHGPAGRQGTGVISGRVYDATTMEPVAFVDVFLDSVRIGAATGADGTFVIRRIPPGTYRLVARRMGYSPYVEEGMHIVPGGAISRSIALVPTEVKAEEVIVTATRQEQTAHMAPASVAILSSSDLQEHSVVTFDQALDRVPGISVHRSSGISVQSLSIRGSSDVAGGGVGNRVLLMIDGRPALSSDSGGALWSLVPMGSIDRIEVVKGAFSSLYGSTAMGGVINVITRRPAYRSRTTVDVGYGLYEKPPPALRYTDRTAMQSQLEFSHSGQHDPLRYLIYLSRKQSDGHSENTAYMFYNVFGKMLYDIRQNRTMEFSVGASWAENDYPHTWMSNLQPLRVAPKYRDDRQKKRNYSADLLYWAVPSARVKYSSRFYVYRKIARSYFNEGDPLLRIPGNQPYGLKTAVNADRWGTITQLDYYVNQRNHLISGVDVQLDHVDSWPDTILFGNRRVNNLALFFQDDVDITCRLTATLGIRYDWNHLVGGDTQGQLSPKWAMVYHPHPYLAVRLLLGQAFRAPSIAERFMQHELAGGTLFKPNPRLKPERMDFSLETGLRGRLGEVADVDIAYFHYRYRDMIYWVEISAEEGVPYTLFQVRNLNRALMKGVEATADVHWKRVARVSLNYTYLDAKDQSPNRLNDLLAYRVRHSFFFSTEVHLGRFIFNLDGRYKSRIEEVFLYPLEAPDAFSVANAKGIVRLRDGVSLSVSVNNLLDTPYEELARYRMPGRNWIVGASMQF